MIKNENLKYIKTCLEDAAKEAAGLKENEIKNQCITDEILEIIKERRKY